MVTASVITPSATRKGTPVSSTDGPNARPQTPLSQALREWNRPPRTLESVDRERTVSFLELFYDLVFVVLIAQIAHTLAGDVSWGGYLRFVVVFLLVWTAWVNGSTYHEYHGGDDGRSRNYIFLQMGALAMMAAFAAHAADDLAQGRRFVLSYVVLTLLLAWQWRQAQKASPQSLAAGITPNLVSLLVLAGAVGASLLAGDVDVRLAIWAGAVVLTTAAAALLTRRSQAVNDAAAVTESLAERFGLLTIVVLGEVVVGVVDGVAESEQSVLAIATGVLALVVAFGLWWCYFDFIGRRVPRAGTAVQSVWVFAHLPLAIGIAGAGAGMVTMIEHAQDSRLDAATGWLVGGSLASALAATALLSWTIQQHPGRRLLPLTLIAGGCAALIVCAAIRPAPIVTALILALVLNLVWWEAFVRHAKSGYAISDT